MDPTVQNSSSLTTSELIAGHRDIEAPFRVRVSLEGRDLDLPCSQIFRLLPGKRVVALAQLDGAQVLAKMFIGTRGVRDFVREKRGVAALVRAGVSTPDILVDGDVSGGGKILIFQYLSRSRSLLDLWAGPLGEEERLEIIRQVIVSIGKMHASGVMQQDIHLDNFLHDSGQLYTIDGGGVISQGFGRSVSEDRGLKNLALFFAQLLPSYDVFVKSVLPLYEQVRGYENSSDRVQRLNYQINVMRRSRKKKVLKKIFRECSQIVHRSGFRYFLVCERRDWSTELGKVLTDPDTAMSRGRTLKNGNSATVVEIEVDGRLLVVKRYNIKNTLHGFKRLFKTSRARRSWYNAHLMELLGIPGAKPVALLEKRWGPICLTTYFVSESVHGPDARECFKQKVPLDEDLQGMAEIVMKLTAHRIAHGDLKDTNFLMSNGGPRLIDLDSMREYRSASLFKKASAKDRRRFLQNWNGQPDLVDRLQTILGRISTDRKDPYQT